MLYTNALDHDLTVIQVYTMQVTDDLGNNTDKKKKGSIEANLGFIIAQPKTEMIRRHFPGRGWRSSNQVDL